MRRILATLVVLALSASFAHATNRFVPPRNSTRRTVPLTMKLWSYRPNLNQSQKSQRPEVCDRTTRRPNILPSISGHKISTEKIKSQRPLIYASDPGTQFPTPDEPR